MSNRTMGGWGMKAPLPHNMLTGGGSSEASMKWMLMHGAHIPGKNN